MLLAWLQFQHFKLNICEYNSFKGIVTSRTLVCGDLWSMNLGLLSFADLVAWLKDETKSMFIIIGLSWCTTRGVTLGGTLEDPLLKSSNTNVNKWISLWKMETIQYLQSLAINTYLHGNKNVGQVASIT